MNESCAHTKADTPPDFDNLDRGVLFSAIGGVIFNGLEVSLIGIVLTLVAAIVYGLMRNRITNIDAFECMDNPLSLPGVNIRYFTLWCQWLASGQLRDGLLGDLVDPEIGGTPEATRQYLRETLYLATWTRAREKIMTLLWLDRYL